MNHLSRLGHSQKERKNIQMIPPTLNLSSMVFNVVEVLMVQVPPSSVTWQDQIFYIRSLAFMRMS